MFFREYKSNIPISEEIIDKYDLRNTAFFDIETTGFNKVSDVIMLISLGCFKGEEFVIKQFFGEYQEDEVNILRAFKEEIDPYGVWCSYNGIAFDEPYVIKKMDMQDISFVAPEKHLDLYRMIKPFQTQLGLERCNLKSVEKLLGVEREDRIDGALTVQLYKQYLYTNNDAIRDTIMLHNYEDVLYLPELFRLLHDIDTNPKYKKPPKITQNQMKYLRKLVNKNNIVLKSNINHITKKAASKAIDAILKGESNGEKIDFLIKDTF